MTFKCAWIAIAQEDILDLDDFLEDVLAWCLVLVAWLMILHPCSMCFLQRSMSNGIMHPIRIQGYIIKTVFVLKCKITFLQFFVLIDGFLGLCQRGLLLWHELHAVQSFWLKSFFRSYNILVQRPRSSKSLDFYLDNGCDGSSRWCSKSSRLLRKVAMENI